MIIVEEMRQKIRGKPVLKVGLDKQIAQMTPEIEAKIRENWLALYDRYEKFYFLVDITEFSFSEAFTVVPNVASLLKMTREKSLKQVESTGVVLSPLAQPIFAAVTALYPPTRPVMLGKSRAEVWEKLESQVIT